MKIQQHTMAAQEKGNPRPAFPQPSCSEEMNNEISLKWTRTTRVCDGGRNEGSSTQTNKTEMQEKGYGRDESRKEKSAPKQAQLITVRPNQYALLKAKVIAVTVVKPVQLPNPAVNVNKTWLTP